MGEEDILKLKISFKWMAEPPPYSIEQAYLTEIIKQKERQTIHSRDVGKRVTIFKKQMIKK